MKVLLLRIYITSIAIILFAGNCFSASPLSQTHQWIQQLENKLNSHDSVIIDLKGEIAGLQQQVDSLTAVKSATKFAEVKGPEIKDDQKPLSTNFLTALFAGLAAILAIAVSVLVPFYFFRENNRLRDEVRSLLLELQRIKTAGTVVEKPETIIATPTVKHETVERAEAQLFAEPDVIDDESNKSDIGSKPAKELSTVESITRLELCIIANQEDEFNHAVAEMVQSYPSAEITTLLRYLHRVAACVFRGRMPAQAPVMAEIRQLLWSCGSPVLYQTDKIVSWARSSTRLSDAQRGYIFSIASELEKIIVEHNRQFND